MLKRTGGDVRSQAPADGGEQHLATAQAGTGIAPAVNANTPGNLILTGSTRIVSAPSQDPLWSLQLVKLLDDTPIAATAMAGYLGPGGVAHRAGG